MSGCDILHLKIIEVAIGDDKTPKYLTVTVKVDTVMVSFHTSSRPSADSELVPFSILIRWLVLSWSERYHLLAGLSQYCINELDFFWERFGSAFVFLEVYEHEIYGLAFWMLDVHYVYKFLAFSKKWCTVKIWKSIRCLRASPLIHVEGCGVFLGYRHNSAIL